MNEFKTYILDNGIKVIYVHKPGELTSVQVCVKVGSINESNNFKGGSHFLEHLLFKGTKKHKTSSEIISPIYNKGGYLNAFTSKNSTCFIGQMSSEFTHVIFNILSDMLLNSVFKEDVFNLEKSVIIEEINQGLDEPSKYLFNQIYKLMYEDHRLENDIGGTPEDILNITRKDVIKYFKKYYCSSNIIISIVTNLDKEQVLKKIVESDFNNFKKKQKLPIQISQVSEQTEPRYSLNYKKLEQTHILIGIKTCNMFSDDRFGLDVITSILGGNMNSRLFIDLREKNGLSYQIEVMNNYYEDTGALFIYTSFDKDSIIYKNEFSDNSIDNLINNLFGNTNTNIKNEDNLGVLPIILDNLVKLKTEFINELDLSNYIGYITGNTDIRAADNNNLVGYYGEQLLFTDNILSINELKKKYNNITKDDIINLSNKYFNLNNISISLLGNCDINVIKEFVKERY